jgi:hypothetical protein
MTTFATQAGCAPSRPGRLSDPRLPGPIPAHASRPLPGERIVAAAIVDPRSGRIVEGACHGEAMARAGICWEDITPALADWIAAHEGFTTTAGRFVTRDAAAAIARAGGVPVGDGPLTSEQLLSAGSVG